MADLGFFPQNSAFDPTLFAVQWDVVFEVLAMIIILAFMIERALAVLFESRLFLQVEVRREQEQNKGTFKPLIAFGVAAACCYVWRFDALSILLQQERASILGVLLTGAVIAGGSKASIKLFHDVFNAKSTEYDRIKRNQDESEAPAQTRQRNAPKTPPRGGRERESSSREEAPEAEVK